MTDLARRFGVSQSTVSREADAARYAGEPGPPPRDVDVLVVGDADEDDALDAARAAEQRLGREVNIHRVPAKSWRAPGRDPFLASVRSRPLFSFELPKDKR